MSKRRRGGGRYFRSQAWLDLMNEIVNGKAILSLDKKDFDEFFLSKSHLRMRHFSREKALKYIRSGRKLPFFSGYDSAIVYFGGDFETVDEINSFAELLPFKTATIGIGKAISGVLIIMGKSPKNQLLPEEYFSFDREEIPLWLKKYKRGEKVNINDFFSSRIVYYPGAGVDGSPIRVFSSAHASHVFLCVDYSISKEEIGKSLSKNAFKGYHLLYKSELSQEELTIGEVAYHLTDDEKRDVFEKYSVARVPTENRYGHIKIYERDKDLGEEHGVKRFAIIYLGADAIATYDALFGNGDHAPFACVIDSYGFDGSYDHFGKDSLMERIAKRTRSLPKYLLCPNHCKCWDGYSQIKDVSGTKNRFVWKRDD